MRPTNNPKPKFLQIRTNQEFIDKIDTWRDSFPVPPSRADAVRTLIEKGIESFDNNESNQSAVELAKKILETQGGS